MKPFSRFFDPGEIARALGNPPRDTTPSLNADLKPPPAGSPPSTQPEWFGAGQSLRPAAQQVIGRAFDYPSHVNLRQTPKGNEGVTFTQLRGLADNYDLLRLVIETRKDQVAKLEWNIQPKGDLPREAKKDPVLKKMCREVEALFRFPDREHDWNTWLRLLLEDMLVIDAPSIYVRRNGLAEVHSLDVIDGATIKRVVDDGGRTPMPPYTAYQQVLKGMPAVDYSTDEMIYYPRNPRPHTFYGLSPTEQVIMTVNIAIRRQVSQLQFYTEGNVPEALIGVPETWGPLQIKEFQDYWDNLLEGNTAQRRHAKFVPGNLSIQYTRGENGLMDQYDEWLARVVCYCFSLPPLPFVRQFNRATAQTHYQMALEEGLIPMMNWVKSLVDRVITRYMKIQDVEFSWIENKEIDPQIKAGVDSSYVRMGVKSIDEVREDLGLDPLGIEHALFGVGPMGVTFVKDIIDPSVRKSMMDQLQSMGQPQFPPGMMGGFDPGLPPPDGMPPDGGPPDGASPDGGPPDGGPPGKKISYGPDVHSAAKKALEEFEFIVNKSGDYSPAIKDALQKGEVPPELEDMLAANGYRIVEDEPDEQEDPSYRSHIAGLAKSARSSQSRGPRKA
jgi:Phage portal protein